MKRLFAFALALLLALSLAACGSGGNISSGGATSTESESSKVSSIVPSGENASSETNSQTVQVQNPVFAFNAPVLSSDLPDFNFSVFEREYTGKEDYSFVYKIKISCPELTDYTPQTIEVPSSVKWDDKRSDRGIELVDIDFDGCTDIQVAVSEGNVNRMYEYYRWNYFAGKGYGEFELKPFFEMVCYQYKLFPDTKQIIGFARSSALDHPRTMYQLGETQNGGWLGKYTPIRWDEQSFDDSMITERVFFMDNEVFNKSVTEKDFDFKSDTVSDNYLRFGIDNPISIDKAQDILRKDKGTVAQENGFPIGYTFEEMCLKDKLSCYKFRAQWLVDNNHWSTIGFYGVTPDGKVYDAN